MIKNSLDFLLNLLLFFPNLFKMVLIRKERRCANTPAKFEMQKDAKGESGWGLVPSRDGVLPILAKVKSLKIVHRMA